LHTVTDALKAKESEQKKPKKVSARKFQADITAPNGVTFSFANKILKVKGPNGEKEKILDYAYIKFDVTQDKILLKATRVTKREKRMMGSFKAHIKNMIRGATEDIVYKLKICSSHFPMQVTVQGDILTLKNFAGERFPKMQKIPKGVDVKVNGDIIEVKSGDKELAGKTAGLIERMTSRPQFDNRVFQDGLFIIEKDGKPIK